MKSITRSTALTILILALAFICQAQNKWLDAQLWYNGKPLHSLITNRFSDYGDGRPDGCVVGIELKLEFKDIDSVNVEGIITDVNNGAPVGHATVKIKRRRSPEETIPVDWRGKFILKKSSPIKKITLACFACRTIIINGAPRKLF